MTTADLEAIARGMVPVVRRAITDALAPLIERNAALETRLLELETRPTPVIVGPSGPVGERGAPGVGIASVVLTAESRLLAHLTDGRSVDAGPVPRGVPGSAGPPGATGERGQDGLNGKDGATGERGQDGLNGKDGATGERGQDGLNGKDGATGERGQDGLNGKDAPAAEDIARLLLPLIPPALEGPRGPIGAAGKDAEPVDVDALVARVAALVPIPKNGTPGPVGLPGAVGEPGPRGPAGPTGDAGQDGVGLTGAVLDRAGHLLLTLSDGTVKDVGLVVGADGVHGVNGKDVAPEAVAATIRAELATWPRPKDGVDGLGFDQVDLVLDETRGWVFRLAHGEQLKEWVLGIPFDAKVWTAGATYPKGAGVTWDGHYWIAQAQTMDPPGEGAPAWRLAVRRGKQGKEGRVAKVTVPARPNTTPPLYGG